ncbi:NACHT domain-containing protein [Allorhizocola rhizosphaerae]|uniref:NACHT domain-containing protein n=1 Tax=Allorhizocola rhizosphaerae TaxID=1872709 RepID=UPI0013C35D5E|nr:NACHT domain-containing protein [Allorhizocola rhizosphaerae]
MTIEVIAIALGGAVVKSAMSIWLGSNKIAVDVVSAAVDVTTGRLTSLREHRRFERMVGQSADAIASRLEPLITNEFRHLPDNERIAATHAVTNTLNTASLTDKDLFAVDLDTGRLYRLLQQLAPDAKRRAGLSDDSANLYDLVLRESCAYVIQFGTALPQAGIAGLAELLRRETELHKLVEQALNRLPERRGLADFERDYRQLVANRLDQVEFFGATLSESSRRYPLSVAYLSLTASAVANRDDTDDIDDDDDYWSIENRWERGDIEISPLNRPIRVPELLSRHRRLFIRGEAGLGKSVLLQWVAVQSARSSFEMGLEDWNDTVPFFVALRRHADGEMPPPERFIAELGRHIAAEMPHGWVHDKLRSGKGVLLVDGLDELGADRREDVRSWLRDLVTSFPRARYILTSRPAAAPVDWLRRDGFHVLDLEPMTPTDIREFVARWHAAMREQARDAGEQTLLEDYEKNLSRELEGKHHLRRLARFPLLCALLCALHRDRSANLPASRMELYEVAMHMLLERRDTERGIDPVQGLTRTAKTLLLQDIAYWLIRNGWTEAPIPRAVERIATLLPNLPSISLNADAVYQHVLERSGLIREPIHGHTDFVHRTFQEYLAGKAAVEQDDIGILLSNAASAEWRETIVMAAGHANPAQRSELIRGLLDQGDRLKKQREASHLLAIACLETAPELAPELRQRIEAAAAQLLPPTSVAGARTLAAGGPYVLDLLAGVPGETAKEINAIIRTVSEIGDPAGITLLERYVNTRKTSVRAALLNAWPAFDTEEYASRIVTRLPPATIRNLSLDHPEQVISAARLVPGVESIDLGESYLWAQPEVLEALSMADGIKVVTSSLAGPSVSCSLTLSGVAAMAVEWSTIATEPLRIGAFLDALLGDLTSANRTGQTVAFRRWPSSEWATPPLHRPRHIDAKPQVVGVCVQDVHSLSDLVTAGISPEYFAALNSPVLTSIDGIRPWASTLRTIAILGCQQADLGCLPAFTRCEALMIDVTADLELVAQMTALQRLFLVGTGAPDLRRLVDAPKLRAVHIDGWNDDWSQYPKLPVAAFKVFRLKRMGES